MAIDKVVLLVGGVGGAKLAYGLKELLPPEKLTIIVNTADDFWLYGLRICPDLDTITYTLGERVNKKTGWGIANDTRQMLGALEELGEETWFGLGDIDLATHLLRTKMLREGATLTEVTARIRAALDVQHPILPMTDDEVATIVDTEEHGRLDFQTYFVRHRWQPTVKALHYTGAAEAELPQRVQFALNTADAVIIGPSNPWLSIAPILALPGMQDCLRGLDVPRVAVSPIVDGAALKGPTSKIMRELDIEPGAQSIADYYGDVINGFVYDKQDAPLDFDGLQTAAFQTVMRSDRDKMVLAENVMNWIGDWA